jgi:hypothetical protein
MPDKVVIGGGRIRGGPCPHCGEILDGYTGASTDDRPAVPEDGSISVCVFCGTILIFCAPKQPWRTWSYRLAAESEIEELTKHRIGRALLEYSRLVKERRKSAND